MNWQTNPAMIGLRNVARKMGLTQGISRLLPRRGNYEEVFDTAMFKAVKPGDIIWDVGANVGYYTRKFADSAGAAGRVFAFEPFPANVTRLRAELIGIETVTVLPVALGAETGTVEMRAGDDELGATSRIVEGGTTQDKVTNVSIATGDSILDRGLAAAPTMIKIDTEGFELDVLNGMQEILHRATLRAVFIEVHFGILADRGMSGAPGRIERLLSAKGFRNRWLDLSHLAAYRR